MPVAMGASLAKVDEAVLKPIVNIVGIVMTTGFLSPGGSGILDETNSWWGTTARIHTFFGKLEPLRPGVGDAEGTEGRSPLGPLIANNH